MTRISLLIGIGSLLAACSSTSGSLPTVQPSPVETASSEGAFHTQRDVLGDLPKCAVAPFTSTVGSSLAFDCVNTRPNDTFGVVVSWLNDGHTESLGYTQSNAAGVTATVSFTAEFLGHHVINIYPVRGGKLQHQAVGGSEFEVTP
jgi:hypothetical protein